MSTEAERQEKLLNAKKKLKSYRARQAQKASQSTTTTSAKRSSLVLSSPSAHTTSHSHARKPSAHRRSASRNSVFGPPSATPAAQKRDSRRLSWNAQNVIAAQLQRERERRDSEASVATATDSTATATPAASTQGGFAFPKPTTTTTTAAVGGGDRHGRRHSRTQSISVSHRPGSFSLPPGAGPSSSLALPQVGLGVMNSNGSTVSPRSTSPSRTPAVSSWTFPRSPNSNLASPSPSPATASAVSPTTMRRLSRPQSLSFSPSDNSGQGQGHARRPSRHARRTSVSTRRESMEIMSGLPLPLPSASSLPSSSASDDVDGNGEGEGDRDRLKRRSEALNALEGRLRLPTSTIDIDSASDVESPTLSSRSPSTVTGSPAPASSPNSQQGMGVQQKRASWGPGSVLGQAAKGAMDLGILEEEDEDELASVSAGGGRSAKQSLDLGSSTTGSKRGSRRKSGGAGRPASLFLGGKSAKRQSWGAGAAQGHGWVGMGKGTMVAEQGTLEPRSPITPSSAVFEKEKEQGPQPSIGYATRSLNHIALPSSTSTSTSTSNFTPDVTSPPQAPHTSLPLSASTKGLRSLTLANLSASSAASSSGASQPPTPGSEAQSYTFAPSTGGAASAAVSPTAAEEKKARRRSSALGMGMSELGYGMPSSAPAGSSLGRNKSLGKRSSISYKNSSLSLQDGQATLRPSQRRNLSSGRTSISGGVRSAGSSLASWGMSQGRAGDEEGDDSEEINFGDLVIGDDSFDAGFGRRSTRSNTSVGDDPLLVSMLRTEIEQLRCDAADREDRSADEVKGLYDRSRELERELDDVRALAREHASVLSAAQSRATEAERARDVAVEEADQWRGRAKAMEKVLERERARGEEERREMAELRERVWAAKQAEREAEKVAGEREEWRERAEKAERELEKLKRQQTQTQPKVEVVRAPPPRSLQLGGSKSDDDVSSTRLSSPASGQSSFSFTHSASSSGATSVLGSGCGSSHGHGNMSSPDVSVPIVLAGTSLQTLAEENEEDDCAVPASVSSHSTSESDCNGPPTPAHLSGVDVRVNVGGAGEQVVVDGDEDEEDDEVEEQEQKSHRRTGSFVRAWTFPHGTVQLVKPLKTRKRKSNKAATGMMSLYVADDEAAISDADEEDDDHTFFQLSRRRKLPPLPVNPASLELPPFFLGGLQIEEPPSTAPSSFGLVMDPLFQQQQHAKRGGSLSVRSHAPPPSRSARYGNLSTSSSSISSMSSQGAADLSTSAASSPSGGSRLSLQNMASLFSSYVAGVPQQAPSAPQSKYSSSSSTPVLGRAQQDSPAGARDRSAASPAASFRQVTPTSGGKRLVDPSTVPPPRASPNRKLDFTRIVGTKEKVIYL